MVDVQIRKSAKAYDAISLDTLVRQIERADEENDVFGEPGEVTTSIRAHLVNDSDFVLAVVHIAGTYNDLDVVVDAIEIEGIGDENKTDIDKFENEISELDTFLFRVSSGLEQAGLTLQDTADEIPVFGIRTPDGYGNDLCWSLVGHPGALDLFHSSMQELTFELSEGFLSHYRMLRIWDEESHRHSIHLPFGARGVGVWEARSDF